jgi:hypothetical protein
MQFTLITNKIYEGIDWLEELFSDDNRENIRIQIMFIPVW